MRDLCNQDKGRFSRYSILLHELLFDFSKTRLDADAFAALLRWAEAAGVAQHRQKMFAGFPINLTEGRAVLHTALRAGPETGAAVDGRPVGPQIARVRAAMTRFANAVRSGRYAVSGGRVRDVVNIGIGGSDLGPAMAARALSPYGDGPRLHFVSNIDGADIADTLAAVDPATTLFIVASKTFTTAETMINAATARAAVEKAVGRRNAARHFVALSTNLEATRAFGIDDDRTFGFWDWVGGRYSVWSAIGLSLMIGIGPGNFGAFLDGAKAVDEHFLAAPLACNIPVVMALVGAWHRNVWGYATHAVLPYDHRLARLPAYLQQLDMESNGKHVGVDGRKVAAATGPVVWGEPGTNGQHAFFQLLHQGTDIVPCDFLVAATPHEKPGRHHAMLLANCFAQSEALLTGRTLAEATAELRAKGMSDAQARKLAPHKAFEGNRPSATFLYRKLTPFTLGMLLALYEHKVFVQGVLWRVNSFDQWGVELGKVLAAEIEPLLTSSAKPTGAKAAGRNSSTLGLVAVARRLAGA